VVKRIATIHQRARNEMLQRQLEQRERVDRLMGRFGTVIEIVAQERSVLRIGRQVRAALTQPEPIELPAGRIRHRQELHRKQLSSAAVEAL
jgi:membrane protein implicated in regulation of membrane protease activity